MCKQQHFQSDHKKRSFPRNADVFEDVSKKQSDYKKRQFASNVDILIDIGKKGFFKVISKKRPFPRNVDIPEIWHKTKLS